MLNKKRKWIEIFFKTPYVQVSMLSGIIAFIVGEFLFERLTERLYTPLGIMLYFFIFFCILFVAMTVILIKKLTVAEYNLKLRSSWKFFLILLIIFLMLTTLFEFLYEIGKEEIPEPTSLIFLIDDSGSMRGNEKDRVQAINDVMKNSRLPFAIYSFTEDAKQLRNMDIYRSDISEDEIAFASAGGTSIIPSINHVLSDLEKGVITNAGLNPKILLVSDGNSSLFGLRSMVKDCKRQMVNVSSIGMRGSSESTLKKIAKSTGGVYVSCTDVTTLGAELTKAIASQNSRNLLSERIIFKNEKLYAFLRIFFLMIMGLLWSALKIMMLSENKEFCRKIFVLSMLFCILGAFLVEFGNSKGISSVFLRLIFDVLWATTPGTLPKKVIEETDGVDSPGKQVLPNNKIKVNMITHKANESGELKHISVGELFKSDDNSGIHNSENDLPKNKSRFFKDNGYTQVGNSLFGNDHNSDNPFHK